MSQNSFSYEKSLWQSYWIASIHSHLWYMIKLMSYLYSIDLISNINHIPWLAYKYPTRPTYWFLSLEIGANYRGAYQLSHHICSANTSPCAAKEWAWATDFSLWSWYECKICLIIKITIYLSFQRFHLEARPKDLMVKVDNSSHHQFFWIQT
jgi:hypothetical protein